MTYLPGLRKAVTDAQDAFLEGYRRRPHAGPAPSLPDLLEQARDPALDPATVARTLARLVGSVAVVADFRSDGPMVGSLRIPLEELDAEQQRQLAAILLAPLRASGGDAAFKALVERLPG